MINIFKKIFRNDGKKSFENYSLKNQKKEFDYAKKELAKKFEEEPSFEDVKWKVYNQKIIEYSSQRKWGLYRNNKLDMAQLLIKEGRHKQALATLFEVCFLDLNGCNNVMEGLSKEDMERLGIQEFSAKSAFLAPAVISMIEKEMFELKLDNESARKLFIDINNQTKPKNSMPSSPENSWEKLSQRMSKVKKIKNLDPTDIGTIFNEISKMLQRGEYSDAADVIKKIKSRYSLKKKELPDIDQIKSYLPELLISKQNEISSVAESLLLSIAKRDYNSVSEILKNHVKHIQREPDSYLESHIIGQIATIDVKLVKAFIPQLIKNIKDHPEWNVRRFSAFNLGAIGSNNPELVKEAVPMLVEYIKHPFDVTKRKPMLDVDQKQWLKDAYIDTLGMIAKGDKNLIVPYKELLKSISTKDSSIHSKDKSKKVLQLLN